MVQASNLLFPRPGKSKMVQTSNLLFPGPGKSKMAQTSKLLFRRPGKISICWLRKSNLAHRFPVAVSSLGEIVRSGPGSSPYPSAYEPGALSIRPELLDLNL